MIPNTDATLHALYWEQDCMDFALITVRAFSPDGAPMVVNSRTSRLVPAETIPGYDGLYDDLTEDDYVVRTMF